MKMRKSYLKEDFKLEGVQEGDFIYFDMPPMCSGSYYAIVYKDEKGLFIQQEDDYFTSTPYYRLNKPYWNDTPDNA